MIYVQASSSAVGVQPLSASSALPLGLDSSRWRFLEKLGEGPIGEVFRVEPSQEATLPGTALPSQGTVQAAGSGLGSAGTLSPTTPAGAAPAASSFALKRILPPMSRDSSFARAFLQTTSRVGRLEHPCLPRVIEHGEASGCLYVVTTYAEGFSLARVLRFLRSSGDGLDPALVCQLFIQLAGALGVAHLARGGDRAAPWPLVHGNLKPSNILLQSSGMPVLLDLGSGAAGLFDPEGSLMWLSRESIRYMAPEVARGAEPDPRSDVWSLGALLFEMLTLEPLVEAASPLTLLRTLPDLDPSERLRLLETRRLPAGLIRVVQGALQRRQKLRFQDAATLADALQEAVLNPPWTPEEYWGELLGTLAGDELAQRPEVSRIYLVPGEDEDSIVPWDLCWMDDVTASEQAWNMAPSTSAGASAALRPPSGQAAPRSASVVGIVLVDDEDTLDDLSEDTLTWSEDSLGGPSPARSRSRDRDEPIEPDDVATEMSDVHDFSTGPLVLHAEELESTDPGGEDEVEDPDITVERPIPSFLEQSLSESALSELGQALQDRAAHPGPLPDDDDEDESQAAVVDMEALESLRSGDDAFPPENEGVSDESFKTVHLPMTLFSFPSVAAEVETLEGIEDEAESVATGDEDEDMAAEITAQSHGQPEPASSDPSPQAEPEHSPTEQHVSQMLETEPVVDATPATTTATEADKDLSPREEKREEQVEAPPPAPPDAPFVTQTPVSTEPEGPEHGRKGGRKRGSGDARRTGKRRTASTVEQPAESSEPPASALESPDGARVEPVPAGLGSSGVAVEPDSQVHEVEQAPIPPHVVEDSGQTLAVTSTTAGAAQPSSEDIGVSEHASLSEDLGERVPTGGELDERVVEPSPAVKDSPAPETVSPDAALSLPSIPRAHASLDFVETEAESAFFGIAVAPATAATRESATSSLPGLERIAPSSQTTPTRRRAGQTTDELWRAPREAFPASQPTGFLTEDAEADLGDTPVSEEYKGAPLVGAREISAPAHALSLPPSPLPLPSIEEDDTAKFELAVLLDRLAQQKHHEQDAQDTTEETSRQTQSHSVEARQWLSEQIPARAMAFKAASLTPDERLGAAPYPTSSFSESTVEISIQDEGIGEVETEVEALSESDMPIPTMPSPGPVDLVRVQKLADGRLEEMPDRFTPIRPVGELPPLELEMGGEDASGSVPYAGALPSNPLESGPLQLHAARSEHSTSKPVASEPGAPEPGFGRETFESLAFLDGEQDFSSFTGSSFGDLPTAQADMPNPQPTPETATPEEPGPVTQAEDSALSALAPYLPVSDDWRQGAELLPEGPADIPRPIPDADLASLVTALKDFDASALNLGFAESGSTHLEESAEDLPVASIPLPASNPMFAGDGGLDGDELFEENSMPLPGSALSGQPPVTALEPSGARAETPEPAGRRAVPEAQSGAFFRHPELDAGADPLSDSNLMIPIELDLLPMATLAAVEDAEEPVELEDAAEDGIVVDDRLGTLAAAAVADAAAAGEVVAEDVVETVALDDAEDALVLDDPVIPATSVQVPPWPGKEPGGLQPGQRLENAPGPRTGPSLEKGPITRSARRTQPGVVAEQGVGAAAFPPPFAPADGSTLRGTSTQKHETGLAGSVLPSLPDRLGSAGSGLPSLPSSSSTVVTTQPVVATKSAPPPPGRQVGGRSAVRTVAEGASASPWDGPARDDGPGRAPRTTLSGAPETRSPMPRTPSWLRPVSRRPVLMEGQQVAGRYLVEHLLLEFPERSVYSAIEVAGDHHRLCYVCGDALNLANALHCQTCGSDLGSRRMTLSMRWDRRRVERNLLLAERSLEHPGLARIYHQFTSEGRLYRLLDLITEDPATGVLLMQLAGPLDELMLAEIGIQVAVSLHYLHQNGINCPFLSEDNIFLHHDRVQLYDLDVDEVVSPGLLPASMRIKDVMVLARVLLPYLPRDGGGLVNVLQDATEGRIGSAEDFAYAMQEAAGIQPAGFE